MRLNRLGDASWDTELESFYDYGTVAANGGAAPWTFGYDDGSTITQRADGSSVSTDAPYENRAPVIIAAQNGKAPILPTDPGALVSIAGSLYKYAAQKNARGQTVYVPSRYTGQQSNLLPMLALGAAAFFLLK